jgi:23S rRNA pseudouridine1911/1915/1917 synthase
MTTKLARGRSAITEYKILRRLEAFTFLEVKIGTGRTHQIRVHLASIGHPVAGDKLYGAPPSPAPRVFLHAHQITFTSPSSGAEIKITAPLPEDLQQHFATLK